MLGSAGAALLRVVRPNMEATKAPPMLRKECALPLPVGLPSLLVAVIRLKALRLLLNASWASCSR